MSEMMRNFAMLLWLACAVNQGTSPAQAQGIIEENANVNNALPTVIVGKAAQPDGEYDEVIVEQPKNSGNPLGNPIPDIVQPHSQEGVASRESVKIPSKPVTAPQAEVRNLGDKFQNTLMESNGMVYDVQAYPKDDLKAIGNPSNPRTIYSPNVNP